MFYSHERYEQKQTNPTNTVWPLMSTNGRDIDAVRAYLKERGLSWELAEANGWYPSRKAMDEYLRIVIPATVCVPDHVYWQARAINTDAKIRYQTPRGPRHGALICVKSDLTIMQNNGGSREVVVVEGPMDALAVAETGCDAIALMGIAPGPEALYHLIKLVVKRPVLVVLDNEAQAKAAAGAIIMKLASAGGIAHWDSLRYVKDLAEMTYAARRAWLDRRLEDLYT